MLAQNLIKINEHGNSKARILKDMQKLLKERSTTLVLTDLNKYLSSQIDTSIQKALLTYPGLPVQLELELAPKQPQINLSDIYKENIFQSCFVVT